MTPAVSVLMAVRDGERWLGHAVESVLAQSCADFECIVVDDASTDTSRDILAACGDARVRCIVNERRLGLAASLNRALAAARGAVVARQDADDESRPERLERQMAFLAAHPEVGVVGTGVDMVDDEGRPAGEYLLYPDHARISWALCFGHPFAHPSVCLRTELLRRVGGYDESFGAAQDHDLWTRLAGRTRFANLDERFVVYRRHDASVSSARAGRQREADARARAAHLSWLTGRHVDEAELFWNALPAAVPGAVELAPERAVAGLVAYARLVVEARRAFARRMRCDAAEARAVDRLAGRRLWNVGAALARVSVPWAAWAVARAMALDPALAGREARSGLRRTVARLLRRAEDAG
ncbi:glycosyltransferase involved in cell wall biosynthesis [Desulfobaculum xiamenense]|uniref:Glycosyltransferase involved in cell wall biosynthesis n=1 Tax=Desulfobaculum xiamenense TaxID=995050 RepID=A0A846QMW9_9BACT|nr:glycosyltransferase [Desulfobaculum xiamenense]NJB68360.1 glycosyltransferase involved in cell wall biosynthesis [Desulfobaculum xiamenense]